MRASIPLEDLVSIFNYLAGPGIHISLPEALISNARLRRTRCKGKHGVLNPTSPPDWKKLEENNSEKKSCNSIFVGKSRAEERVNLY